MTRTGEITARALLTTAAAAFACVLAASACSTGTSSTGPAPTPSPTNQPSPTPQPTATPDTGDGHHGDIVIDLDKVVNVCTVIQTSGTQTLALADATGLAVGDRVLVLQTQDDFATSGPTLPVTAPGVAATAEIRRITAIDNNFVTVDASLKALYESTGTLTAQACLVPEYHDVTITATGRLLAQAWDGATGGIVAFYANGATVVNGTIDVSGTGFRGGQPGGNSGTEANVTGDDTTNLLGGGKGEGLDARGFGTYGRGSVGNAGGGGNAHNAGGGGGGSGGTGGLGGFQAEPFANNPDTQGRAGGAVSLTDVTAIVLGGGGGSGQQNGSLAGAGGAGGGAIRIVAASLSGNGALIADGVAGEDSGSAADADGAGGGGAGGTILLWSVSQTFTGTISARGAVGGDSLENTNRHGPGGGGGGGIVALWGVDVVPDVSGGGPGGAFDGSAHGATVGGTGAVLTLPDL